MGPKSAEPTVFTQRIGKERRHEKGEWGKMTVPTSRNSENGSV